jgi:HEAT repeat protein
LLNPFRFMRHKRSILLACLLVAVLGFVTWRVMLNWWGPWYGGKPLAFWLDDYGAGPAGYKPSPKTDEALRHLGADAVPYLLRLLHSTNAASSATKRPMYSSYPGGSVTGKGTNLFIPADASAKVRLMGWVERHTPIRFHWTHPSASWNHWTAYLAFQALGTLGKPAMSDLIKLAHDPSGQSNPSGTGNAPNIAFWNDKVMLAEFANQSSTYLAIGQPPFMGSESINTELLVDGEIAAWSLAAMGQDSVQPLMKLLTNDNTHLRCRGAVALGMMGPAAEPAVPALVKMLHDPDINTRWEVADALGCIGRRADLVVPALTASLNDPNVGMRSSSMTSLGNYRERATSAIPSLLANFASRDYRDRDSAAVALSKISRDATEKEVMPALVGNLRDPQWRFQAVVTLVQMKDEPDLVIPPLIEMMDDTNQTIRGTAICYVGMFGPAAKAAVPKLTSLTNDLSGLTRTQALAALQKIQPGQ